MKPPVPTHEPDIDGEPVLRCCSNCEHLYDDSDGPEYGPPSYRCSAEPRMENLKGFPFNTPQHCFELHYCHLVDWAAEAKKDYEEFSARQAGTKSAPTTSTKE